MNAIVLNNISKMYRIYGTPKDKLKEALIRGIFRSQHACHREFWALQDINMEVPKGISLGILGQNGSGKSTLLQIISGILQPTNGILKIQGRISALLELGAGFNVEFTGRENVFMNGAILGVSGKEMEERFKEIEEFADIGDFIDQPVKTYSSGMFVRLAFSVAVHVDPDILIVDEALAVGDAMFVNRCFRRMEEFKKDGKTIIFVSHDLQAIRTFCDQAILIDGGRILSQGEPNRIASEYAMLTASREVEYAARKKTKEVSDKVVKRVETDSEYRYGTGDAEIVDFNIIDKDGNSTDILEHGNTYFIHSTARFYRSVQDPIMGFIIRTLPGFEITAVSSTLSSNTKIGPVESGMLVTTEFELKMILNPDKYMLSVGVSENTESHIRPLDRRWDAKTFSVIGHSRSYGQIDMGVVIRVAEKRVENVIA